MKVETPSLQASDDAAAAVQKTPNRVTLDSMKAKIISIEYIYPESIEHMTICVLITENGFSLIGKTAPADPANFDEELGKRFAFEDAIRQMWPLEAYLLRQQMTEPTDMETKNLGGDWDAELHEVTPIGVDSQTKLAGNIFADRKGRYPDGSPIVTSVVVTTIDADNIYVTRSGTRYKVVSWADYAHERVD